MQQDNRGLIWVGTDNGLTSFDGLNFNNFIDSTYLLSSGRIQGIKKTKDGKFWIQKENTPPILFNPEMKVIESDFSNKKIAERLEVVITDGNGPLINFIDGLGQSYYLDNNQKILPYPTTKKSPFEQQLPTSWNTLLVSHQDSNRIEELDTKGNIQRVLYPESKIKEFYDSIGNFLKVNILSLKETTRIQDCLFSLEKEGSFSPILLKKNNKALTLGDLNLTRRYYFFFKLTKDSRGNIWLGINNRLWLFDNKGNYKEDITKRLSTFGENINWNIHHFFIDKDDRLWISTGIGLFLLQLEDIQFDYYLVENNEYSTRGITELPNNRLLILTYNGINILDKTTKEILWKSKDYGLGLAKVGPDMVYFGTEGEGLQQLRDTEMISHYDPKNPRHEKHFVRLPFWDEKSSQLFLGMSKGIYVYVNDSIQKYEKLNDFKELEQYPITSFHQNEEGIWIGTSSGIYLLDPEKGVVDYIELPYQHVTHIHEDAAGDFWIATGGGGLIHWERSKNNFRQLTTNQGLSHNFIYAVYEDEAGYLWLPSNNGLMRFDKKNEEVVTFNTSEGIAHQEFNSFSHYQAKDGRLYFGGLNGVIAFYPNQINSKKNNAPFIVTELLQYDAKKGELVDNSTPFLLNKRVELAPGDKFFTLNFSLLDFAAEPPSFAWKIDDLDTEWNFQRENSLRINSLPPGNHTLQLKAKGRGGNWATNKLSIPIIVKQSFFLSPLFFTICGILLISMFYLGYKIRLSNLTKRQIFLENEISERTTEISKKNQQLTQLNSDKDQFFSIIGHDLRGPLLSLRGISKKVSFLIQQNRMKEVHELGETIERSTEQVTKLLDNLLNWALVQKGRFPYHPALYNVQSIVQEMCDVYKSAADLKNISLHNLTVAHHVVYVDRNALSTIVRNLIDNAIKFTDTGGKIQLESMIDQEEIILRIADTGTGISPETMANIFVFSADRKKQVQGSGLGLVLCKDLIEMNNGTIEVESTLDKGTIFIVRIPRSGPVNGAEN